MSFAEKAFLVCGAASDIGQALCMRLSAEGAFLLMTGRSTERLERLRRSLAHPERCAVRRCEIDEASFSGLKNAMADFLNCFSLPGFSGGVYCPGLDQRLPLRSLTWAFVDSLLRVNFTGALMTAQLLARREFRLPEGSSIVWISSVSALRGAPSLSVYAAAKGALISASKSLACELAKFKVRVNCVCAGCLEDHMTGETEKIIPGYLEQMKKLHPLGLGTADDVTEAVLSLLSGRSRWITGTTLTVDGGYLAS
jgi:NAD(P)-dependent dehydrogenase (short-subunit alcohol dehydrogenase family)